MELNREVTMTLLQNRLLDSLKVTMVLLLAATVLLPAEQLHAQAQAARVRAMADKAFNFLSTCLLYTSDAADE